MIRVVPIIEKTYFYESKKKELANAIFEHFIISQFIYNYIKYQIKEPEHYPLEIRYFIIFSYLKISEDFLKTNPFSAYITCIALKEIINFLKLEKGFKKQKYIKNSNINNIPNNNVSSSSKKNSTKKSKRRRSISRSKNKKRKAKKKSNPKIDNSKEKIEIDSGVLDNYIKTVNETNNENNANTKVKDRFIDEIKLDEPEKLISKALFNYLCLVYSMEIKYKEFSKYFEELYSFIDIYIYENINSISIDDDEWAWLLIYPIIISEEK